MDEYQQIRQAILDNCRRASHLTTTSEKIPGIAQSSLAQWRKTSDLVEDQLQKEVLRVAAIGPIKSGKSTFINALLKNDYLKRGAGVVTSIVTRVRKGADLSATLYFKSWDEINDEIRLATALFPSNQWRSRQEPFDLRRRNDRGELRAALANLNSDHLITGNTRNPDSVIMMAYLDGYDQVFEQVGADQQVKSFNREEFARHRDFVGNDSLAVYLKDILLRVETPSLAAHMEVADCQGSDSPNPRHMAMIQDYLMVAHLFVYVISSRTGLREADIRFLSMIKKMGLLGHILFVVNCDFSEHDNLEDLTNLLARLKQELSMLKSDPEIFTFSALHRLYGDMGQQLPEKERRRLEIWENEEQLVAFSNSQADRFLEMLQQRLSRERYPLLLHNHIEHLDRVFGSMTHQAEVNLDLLRSDSSRIEQIVTGIDDQRKKIEELGSMIRSTLNGAVEKIKQDLRMAVDRYFDPISGETLAGAIDFIRSYQPAGDQMVADLEAMSFNGALYQQFQIFKQACDRYMTEMVNPRILGFVRETEQEIFEKLTMVAKPYEVMVKDALDGYNRMLAKQGLPQIPDAPSTVGAFNLEAVKSVQGLSVPSAGATMHYSAKVKSEAWARFGAYSLGRWVRKLFKKGNGDDRAEGLKALKVGVARMRREMEESLKRHFVDHRETLKFQYLFKLVDLLVNALHEGLMAQFATHQSDLSEMVTSIKSRQLDEAATATALEDMIKEATAASEELAQQRRRIAELSQKPPDR
jgi:hypothetical protein